MASYSFYVKIPDADTAMPLLNYDFLCREIRISFYEQSQPSAIVWVGENPETVIPGTDETTGGPESDDSGTVPETGVRGEAVYERDTAIFTDFQRPSDCWVACGTAGIELGVRVIT